MGVRLAVGWQALALNVLLRIHQYTKYFTANRLLIIIKKIKFSGLPSGFFPKDLSVKILKELLHSSILGTCPAHLNFLDLITQAILGVRF